MLLNPNCSEVVWRLKGYRRNGRNEFETDTSSYDTQYELEEMINLLSEARDKGKDLNKVSLELVENCGGGGDSTLIEFEFKVGKAVVENRITKEQGTEILNVFIDQDSNTRELDVEKYIKDVLNPNCSEAVFRFHTTDPRQMQEILQAIADEINANSDFELHKNQKIPLFEKPEQYDTQWNKELTYSGNVREKYEKEINKNWKQRDEGKITQEKALEVYGEIEKRMSKEIYPNAILYDCAGLGDNEAVIKVNKKKGFFTLNIGNNDIEPNKTGWVEKVKELKIKVEEAETCEELQKIARDCTCGINFGF